MFESSLLCDLLPGPASGDGATECVFSNGETEPQVQLPGLAQSKCLRGWVLNNSPLTLGLML